MNTKLLEAAQVISGHEDKLLALINKSLSLSVILSATLKDFCKDCEGEKSAKDLLKDHFEKIAEASKQSIREMGEMLTDFDAIMQSQQGASLALAMIESIAEAKKPVIVPSPSPVLPVNEPAATAKLSDQQAVVDPGAESETVTTSTQKDGIID